MQRSRRAVKRSTIIEDSSDSEDDIPLKKLHKLPLNKNVPTPDKKKLNSIIDSSSSESDIENYLQPVDKIDLTSSFFNVQKKNEEEFAKIEKNIFAGVTRLSDSDSDEDINQIKLKPRESENKLKADSLNEPSTSTVSIGTKLNFQQLEDYTRKIEEAKRHIEEYNAKKKAEENNIDVSNLLAVGESKQITLENIKPEDLHSSDFESCDSEQEDWEEVKVKDSQEVKEKSLVPKDGLQITLDMPDTCRKKKGVDLLAAMKRRLNRIRKENQVYVHKVHLLCWIAHGNYVNEALNSTKILGLALSLLPSDKCYPSDRTDLSYLEQIVQWYKKYMQVVERAVPKKLNLVEALELQINKKQVYNKKMLVYIFIAMLRSLGIQCRLVLSFQLEPLRPPASELHSLAKDSTQTNTKGKGSKVEDKDTSDNITEKTSVTAKKSALASKSPSVLKDDVKSTTKGAISKVEEKGKKEPAKIKNKTSSVEEKKSVMAKKVAANVGQQKENVSKVKKESIKIEKISANTSKAPSTKKENDANTIVKLKGGTKREDKEKETNSKSNKSCPTENIKKSKASSSKDATQKEVGGDIKSSTAKKIVKAKDDKSGSSAKSLTVKKDKNVRSKSEDNTIKEEPSKKNTNTRLNVENKRRSRSVANSEKKAKTKKDKIKVKFPPTSKQKGVPQLDGINNSSDEDVTVDFIPQFDGAGDKNEKKSIANKPNLKKLKSPIEGGCKVKKHPSRLKFTAEATNSEDEFRPRSPLTIKNVDSPRSSQNLKVNLHILKDSSLVEKNRTHCFNSPSKKQLDVKNDIVNLIKGRIAEQKHIDRNRKVKKRKPSPNETDSDSDYMPEPVKKKQHDSDSDIDYFVPKPKVKKRVSVQRNRTVTNILSSGGDNAGKKKKMGNDVWVEVFLESEEKWISVDVVQGQVHCVNELYTRATHPVSYIVAWNNDNGIKDVSRRYCTNFNTITRKLRVDAKWWEESIKPFFGKYTARDKEEDEDLNRQQLDQPFPKSIAEYKNHPLYVLRRHLLKFEDIYPSNIQPIGLIRGELVYPRNCVYVCRSRDIWLKEAKVVKPGEKPYKIVKARPKYDKLSNQIITDQMLEIFGEWQTMDYEPPTAENGVVPRNAFGNVELFKPCMLPKGTVHLKLPGLNKICRRMDIDCASAIVGFDFHCGWSHPMYDGFVVCEEFADTLVAAWELEQEEIERKENEKIEKRVYTNWKKLIKGLLIRERLKARYDFGGASTSGDGSKEKKKAKGPKFCTKKRRMYSDSESESDKT